MNTPHTPGPWNISKHATPDYAPQFGIYAEGCRNDLAYVVHENTEANARLIAAAPDLLAALQAILDYEDDRPAKGTFGAKVYRAAEDAIRQVTTA